MALSAFRRFITACGATHLLEVWNLWHAQYWLAGAIKALTAAASLGTALVLIRSLPKLLIVPNLKDWARANASLEIRIAQSIGELRAVNESLLHSRETLGLAQKAARMGAWERDVATGRSTWTAELAEVFGVQPGSTNETARMWPNLVHPTTSLPSTRHRRIPARCFRFFRGVPHHSPRRRPALDFRPWHRHSRRRGPSQSHGRHQH